MNKKITMTIFVVLYGVKISAFSIPKLTHLRGKLGNIFSAFSGNNTDICIYFLDGELPSECSNVSVKLITGNTWTEIKKREKEIKEKLYPIFSYSLEEIGYTLDNVSVILDDSYIDRIQKKSSNKGNFPKASEAESEYNYKNLSKYYVAEKPKFSFDRLVISKTVRNQIEEALTILSKRDVLFEKWGLSSIMNPSVLLNFYGESGTGKTMGAEAVADKLGKSIIRATYADIESKYHGEGPKMLKALFLAAQEQDAVLFIDEADSMLSARLSGVSEGSEQAINSMKSQLLISLENYNGVVIFATNLIENYDKAFLTRLICIEFKRPDFSERKAIWYNHLYPVGGSTLNIPLAEDVDIDYIAQTYHFCGRDIRNAVKKACIHALTENHLFVCKRDFIYACDDIVKSLVALELKSRKSKSKHMSTEEEKEEMEKIKKYYVQI